MAGPYYYSGRLSRVLLAAMRAELGRDQLNAVLQTVGVPPLTTGRLASPEAERRLTFEAIGALQAAVEQHLGETAGRQMNRRIGQSAFQAGLQDFEPIVGLADLPQRRIPLGMKFRVGLDVFARVFTQFSDQVVRVADTANHHLWIIERCPVCWGRRTADPCCHLAGGVLAAAAGWASGGRRFVVEESQCQARGDRACVFQIAKTPLE